MASVLGFYSWMERGLAPFLIRDTDDSDPYVMADAVIDEVKATTTPHTATAQIFVAAPWHVVGIEPGIVSRVWPKAGVTDAETDYFPIVELADADFPWRYSPDRHQADDIEGIGSQRVPWVALVVLREDEFDYQPAGPTRRLPAITVKDPATSLPPVFDLHLWAHTQVNGEPTDGQAVAQTLRQYPERALSRLVCPRFLAPKQRYRAFLVPTYRGGAEVGLGRPVTSKSAFAWAPPTSGPNLLAPAVDLPVYYEWSFLTGDVGSFYDLARRLVPRKLDGPGTRTMDVSRPGLSALDDLSASVQVGGALRPFEATDYVWPPADRTRWRNAISGVLEPPIDLGDTDEAPPKPTLAPPLYGRWYAGKDAIQGGESGGSPPWFQELNEAPHHRVPAALGTGAVQANQQALMASAWQQVDGLLAANQQIRQAQLAREASLQSYRRHWSTAPRPGRLLQVVGSVFGRVLLPGGRTVLDAVRQSPIPDGFFDAAWRRLTRPLGPLGRRQGRPGRALPPLGHDTVEDLNQGTIDPAPLPLPLPDGAVGPGAGAKCPCCLTPELVRALAKLTPDQAYRIGETLFIEGHVYAGFGTLWRVAVMRLGAMLVEAAATPGGLAAFRDRVLRECSGAPASDDVNHAPPIAPPWTPVEPVPDNPGTPPAPAPEGTTPSQNETDFRGAVVILLNMLNAEPPPGPVLTRTDISVLRTEIITALNPGRTIGMALRGRLLPQFRWTPADPLEPLLVVPEFGQPMYEALRDISTEWILPGIGEIPANTMGMVKTNRAFIEAYMVGLNHEMGRELLWHEYPNDLRGTYFRQFWDVRGKTARPDARDIKQIHTWGDTTLGGNAPPPPLDPLVLFIRGDLLHRYPMTVVYMARATGALPPPPPEPEPQPREDEEKYALFRGRLGSDAGIHGFELTKDDARGSPSSPGWYVILQEPPGEPRFGPPEAYPPPNVPPPTADSFLRTDDEHYDRIVPSEDSAAAAEALYRNPVRVAFHSAMMLP